MNAQHIAAAGLEIWRASGLRTRERLAALVTFMAESYFGSSARWAESIRDEMAKAQQIAQSQVRMWEEGT